MNFTGTDHKSLRILLLQAREASDNARIDEHRSFARQTGLDEANIVPFDLLDASPSLAYIRKYDALMVGGSGDYYVSKENLPGYQDVLSMLREVVAVGHPTFASCFGFQMLVAALEGEIVYDEENMEVGTYEVTLTNEGHTDELFGRLPPSFMAQLGHKDAVTKVPPTATILATSERSYCQSIRIPGKPMWATQFHPELTAQENLRRFRQYIDGYASMMNPKEIEATLSRFQESPHTDLLLPGFLELVFG